MPRPSGCAASFAALAVTLVLANVVSTGARAQTPEPAPAAPVRRVSQDAAVRLHAAWLRELLDLDVRGAVAEYQALAADRQSRHVRWIAVARLAELQRLGIDVGTVPPTDDAPQEIKAALALLTPLPVEDLLRQARAGGGAEINADGESGRGVELRPATPAVQAWVRLTLGPTPSERQRQRIDARAAAQSGTPRADPSRLVERDRRYAMDVVSTELDGKAGQAERLRELYFPDWKPVQVRLGPEAALARVRTLLEAWLEQPNVERQQQQFLTRLRDELHTRAAQDPAAALAFVARLPWYGERLLADPPAEPPAEPK